MAVSALVVVFLAAARGGHGPRLLGTDASARRPAHGFWETDASARRPRCLARRSVAAFGLYIPHRMKIAAMTILSLACAAVLGACGSQGIQSRRRAPTTAARCCSATTAPAATRSPRSAPQGSATSIAEPREDQRPELQHPQGERRTGRSTRSATAASPGAIMPENIVVGAEAKAVAAFLAEYSGRQAQKVPATNIHARRPNRTRSTARRMLDLRLIREDPDGRPRGARATRRGRRGGARRGDRARRAPPRAAAASSRHCAPSRTRPTQRIRASGERRGERAREIEAMRERRRAGQGARAGARERRGRARRRRSRRCRTCPTRAPRAGREDALVRDGRRASRARLRAARPPRAGRRADRHGRAARAVGIALRLPQGRPRDARAGARALGAREARGATASSR